MMISEATFPVSQSLLPARLSHGEHTLPENEIRTDSPRVVSLAGFLQAFWTWTRVPAELRRTQRGYGTTSGGLAIEEEGFEGLLDG
jgi:hypothetical protein